MQCQAKAKSTGEQCGRRAVAGKRVCTVHGGLTPSGPASPQWKDGGRSKYLPKRLLDDYQASLDNPDKLVLDGEIALIDARLSDVLRRVDSGESGRLWSELRETVREYEAAQRARDTAAVALAVNTLVDLVKRGQHDSAAWGEVTSLIERRRKLVESERKRLVEAHKMIAVEQALGMMGLLIESVRRNVHDDDALRAVVADFTRITAGPGT